MIQDRDVIRCTVQPEEMVPGALVSAAASLRTVISSHDGCERDTRQSMVHLRACDVTGAVSFRDSSRATTARWRALWAPPCR